MFHKTAKLAAPSAFFVLLVLLSADANADSWDPGDDNWLDGPSVLTVACMSKTHGPHTLSSSDPRDCFRMRLTKNHTYSFSASAGSGRMVASLNVDIGDGLLLERETASGTGSFSITYTPIEPLNSETQADWILIVEPAIEAGSATYSLLYHEPGCPNVGDDGSNDGGGMQCKLEICGACVVSGSVVSFAGLCGMKLRGRRRAGPTGRSRDRG